MTAWSVRGPLRLHGTVRVGGSRIAALPMIAAAFLTDGVVHLENIPCTTDVQRMLETARQIGMSAEIRNGDVVLGGQRSAKAISYEDVMQLRSVNLFLAPILARHGEASISLPSADEQGSHPMDLHIKGLVRLGAQVQLEHGVIHAQTSGLRGARIYLDFPSVGATETLMLAAVTAQGTTYLENAAKEPEIVALANLLNSMGGRVRGAGTETVRIEGVTVLSGARHPVIADRTETAWWMIAAAVTRGDIQIQGCIPEHLVAVSAKLREAGVEILECKDQIQVRSSGPLHPIDIKTLPYPGFPTDAQSAMLVLLTQAPGTGLLVENLFEERLQLTRELVRLGGMIRVEGRLAVVEGPSQLVGARVEAEEPHMVAALLMAGLVAQGESIIYGIENLERIFEGIEQKLLSLGVSIKHLP